MSIISKKPNSPPEFRSLGDGAVFAQGAEAHCWVALGKELGMSMFSKRQLRCLNVPSVAIFRPFVEDESEIRSQCGRKHRMYVDLVSRREIASK